MAHVEKTALSNAAFVDLETVCDIHGLPIVRFSDHVYVVCMCMCTLLRCTVTLTVTRTLD